MGSGEGVVRVAEERDRKSETEDGNRKDREVEIGFAVGMSLWRLVSWRGRCQDICLVLLGRAGNGGWWLTAWWQRPAARGRSRHDLWYARVEGRMLVRADVVWTVKVTRHGRWMRLRFFRLEVELLK